MLFSPINASTLVTSTNDFIAHMKTRGSARYSDFNSYNTNPNVVFPLSEVPWNNGYNTFVAINKTHVGLPVYKNDNLQIFVGAVRRPVAGYGVQFEIFYSKQRHGKPIKLKSWASFNEREHFELNPDKFAQKFGIAWDVARLILSIAICQAGRIYWLGDAHGLGVITREKFTASVADTIAAYPKYAAKLRREKARVQKQTNDQVQNINNTTTAIPEPTTAIPEPTPAVYVFTIGDKVVGGGKYLNDYCARTEANRVLMKSIVEGASADSVMRVHKQLEVCAFKLTLSEV